MDLRKKLKAADEVRTYDQSMMAGLQEQLEKARKTAKEAASTSVKKRKAVKKAVDKTLGDWEWGARHHSYAHTKNGRREAVPTCPICGRMNPQVAGRHREAGHTQKCWFPRFREEVLKHFR
jgi:hypothetical protein